MPKMGNGGDETGVCGPCDLEQWLAESGWGPGPKSIWTPHNLVDSLGL